MDGRKDGRTDGQTERPLDIQLKVMQDTPPSFRGVGEDSDSEPPHSATERSEFICFIAKTRKKKMYVKGSGRKDGRTDGHMVKVTPG